MTPSTEARAKVGSPLPYTKDYMKITEQQSYISLTRSTPLKLGLASDKALTPLLFNIFMFSLMAIIDRKLEVRGVVIQNKIGGG